MLMRVEGNLFVIQFPHYPVLFPNLESILICLNVFLNVYVIFTFIHVVFKTSSNKTKQFLSAIKGLKRLREWSCRFTTVPISNNFPLHCKVINSKNSLQCLWNIYPFVTFIQKLRRKIINF